MSVRNKTIAAIKKNPFIGEDTSDDHNKVEFLLLVKYMIRTFKLVIVILNFSYFIGIGWLILCENNELFTFMYYRDIAEAETVKDY